MSNNFKDLLVKLRQEAPSGAVEYLQLKLEADTIAVFVEDEADQVFYDGFISVWNKDINLHYIWCHGKAGVIRAKSFLDNSATSGKENVKFFFCDRDFDKYRSAFYSSDIFLTRWYSIETYCICEEFISYVLRKHCKVTNKHRISSIKEKFFEHYEQLCLVLAPLFAAMCVERSVAGVAKLDQIAVINFVEFDKAKKSFSLTCSITEIISKLGLTSIERPLVEEMINCMLRDDFRYWVRGRHGWQCAKLVWEKVLSDEVSKQFSDAFSKNALKDISAAMPIPVELSDYLEERTAKTAS